MLRFGKCPNTDCIRLYSYANFMAIHIKHDGNIPYLSSSEVKTRFSNFWIIMTWFNNEAKTTINQWKVKTS